jgi:arylsulfatase A-like enzyme
VLLSGIVTACGISKNPEPRPNIIYILADDLGYGDLGCYGQKKISTPNIDSLASLGMIFKRHYAGSTVSAPSRCCLMTGLHTGHAFIRGNRETGNEGQYPLPRNAFTVAELLKKAGYVTGAFGKWGLGMNGTEGDPNSQGFDTFFGYLCQRYAHRYYPEYLWNNGEKYFLEGNDWNHKTTYAPDVIFNKSLDFIKQNKDASFFLYLPVIIPHAELLPPEDSLFLKYLGSFPESPFGENSEISPFNGNDYGEEDFNISGYAGQETPHAAFAAMVSRLDYYVGELMDLLNELGLDENTLIIFSSDNGPHKEGGGDPDFFDSNGPLKGYKRDLYEGGIRIPMIAAWKNKIKPGSVSNHVSAFWDIMPTFADLVNQKIPGKTDGISLLPELTGEKGIEEHDYLYWEFSEQNGKIAVLRGDWKYIRTNALNEGQVVNELYNLKDDESESVDLSAEYPEIMNEMSNLVDEAHIDSPLFEFEYFNK